MAPRAVLALLWILWSGSVHPEGRTITLVGDRWCPFNCNDHSSHRGMLVEQAAAALAKQGITLEYVELPWSRAIRSVQTGQHDAIVGAGRAETPGFHFPSEPLAYARHSFFTLPSDTWTYSGLSSLKQKRIGVIQGYSYGGLYRDYIKMNQDDESRVIVLRGNQVLPRLIEMLRLGRIDALVAEEQVINYHFASSDRKNPLRYAGLANKEALYVAFSPALNDGAELAEALGHGRNTADTSP